jgi:hypothetical protein
MTMKLSNFLHDLTTATAIFDLDYDCFSMGQLESKEWLIEVLDGVRRQNKINFGTIYILCGWYGTLAAMLFYKFTIDKIRSFDIDEKCEKIADQINKTYSADNWRFKAVTQDIFDINFEKHTWQCWSNKNNRMSYPIEDIPNTIINTGCEHTSPKWFENIPKGKLVILQSHNSFNEIGHINAVTCKEEFESMYPMSHIFYSGQMKLTDKYKRFMMIGAK